MFFILCSSELFNLIPYVLFQTLAAPAHSVMHHGIPLQAGTAQFGCSDAFQQTLIICPPTIQGMVQFKCSVKKIRDRWHDCVVTATPKGMWQGVNEKKMNGGKMKKKWLGS